MIIIEEWRDNYAKNKKKPMRIFDFFIPSMTGSVLMPAFLSPFTSFKSIKFIERVNPIKKIAIKAVGKSAKFPVMKMNPSSTRIRELNEIKSFERIGILLRRSGGIE